MGDGKGDSGVSGYIVPFQNSIKTQRYFTNSSSNNLNWSEVSQCLPCESICNKELFSWGEFKMSSLKITI